MCYKPIWLTPIFQSFYYCFFFILLLRVNIDSWSYREYWNQCIRVIQLVSIGFVSSWYTFSKSKGFHWPMRYTDWLFVNFSIYCAQFWTSYSNSKFSFRMVLVEKLLRTRSHLSSSGKWLLNKLLQFVIQTKKVLNISLIQLDKEKYKKKIQAQIKTFGPFYKVF